ncbi:LiaF transmembrane domain-containing protein [Caldanaerobacter sp.]|uniref:LiaF transmembrane domain-containing protein n=1 Tax=Caldanaerobacter sp. TaxID=2930036 RepID=UPI003C790D97
MRKRTGIFTSGIFLIFVGMILILEKFYIAIPYFVYEIIWPCFFIFLGLEFLFSRKLYGEENSGINVGAILLAILMLFFTSEIFYLPPFDLRIW